MSLSLYLEVINAQSAAVSESVVCWAAVKGGWGGAGTSHEVLRTGTTTPGRPRAVGPSGGRAQGLKAARAPGPDLRRVWQPGSPFSSGRPGNRVLLSCVVNELAISVMETTLFKHSGLF